MVRFMRRQHIVYICFLQLLRLKIIGGMDISEKRKPQDGRITMEIDKIEYDIRVSILRQYSVRNALCDLRRKERHLQEIKRSWDFQDEELKAFDHILMNTKRYHPCYRTYRKW